MAHNIWGQRFYGHREPGWHGLGITNDRVQTAVETGQLLGFHQVGKQPLYLLRDGAMVECDYSLIVREPTADDPVHRIHGSPVHKGYELINPYEAAKMWDKKTGAPVETMAMLAKGEQMFITAALPTIQVAGFDEVRNYLLFHNPMVSGMGAAVYVTSIRTECENKLRAGIAAASQSYTVSHREGGRELLGNWLKARWAEAQTMPDLLQEVYDILAKKSVKEVQVKWIAEDLYPLPNKPERSRPRLTPYREVVEEWERNTDKIKQLRTTVVDLFNGQGTGLSDSRIAGTAWAAWNAVAEVETYRKGRREAMVMSLTNGERANRIMQAQRLLTNINTNTRRQDIVKVLA